MKNYLTYPMQTMNITQTYNGNTSHKPHTTGNIKDYPVDDGGKDSGRDYVLCPCDRMKVVRIYGVGNSGTNTVWLTSTEKVFFADGTSDYVTIMFIHPGDDDLKNLKVGKTFVRNEKMFREGKDGATANHIHIAVGKGKMKGNGWAQNSNKKWVLTTTGGTVKPEKAFYLSKETKVRKNSGLAFKELPKEIKYITIAALNIRSAPSATSRKVGLYAKGKEITVTDVVNGWGLTEKGWVCLTYAKKKVM